MRWGSARATAAIAFERVPRSIDRTRKKKRSGNGALFGSLQAAGSVWDQALLRRREMKPTAAKPASISA